MPETFDQWPEKYDQWFATPIGRLVRKYESDLLSGMILPQPGETILDAGCGTGIFTTDFLDAGARVVGVDLSLPMLLRAVEKFRGSGFSAVRADMRDLPFADASFDKAVSVTAVEFVEDARSAIGELFRVVRPGGVIVAATLNRLSPWAERRTQAAARGHDLFRHVRFRSPDELLALACVAGIARTAVYFQKHDDPQLAPEIESRGRLEDLNTGAFLAARWEKPKR
jgi:ubiquinone/menaquinone biosynthesis C-methylase UbiE